MHIDIHTRFITLLGDPLAQSFAARMQNRGYEAAGLNLVYFYTVTGQEHLGDIVNGLRYMPVAGFAVTKPNKVKVLEYLDELDPLCRKMGSSNTVVKLPDGRLKGYNTDGTGFYTALTEAGIDVTKERFSASAAAAPAGPCAQCWPIMVRRRSGSRTCFRKVPAAWWKTSTKTSPRWPKWFPMRISPKWEKPQWC